MAPSGRGLHKGLVSLLCIRLGLDRVGLEGLRIGDDLLDHAEEPRRARGLLVVLEAWRRRRARRLLASDLYDSTIFIHHRFINLAKTIKMSTSDSSFSAVSKLPGRYAQKGYTGYAKHKGSLSPRDNGENQKN